MGATSTKRKTILDKPGWCIRDGDEWFKSDAGTIRVWTIKKYAVEYAKPFPRAKVVKVNVKITAVE